MSIVYSNVLQIFVDMKLMKNVVVQVRMIIIVVCYDDILSQISGVVNDGVVMVMKVMMIVINRD